MVGLAKDDTFAHNDIVECVHKFSEPLFAGFALKLVLNAISTGANILKGKVFKNAMINLTVANDKVSYEITLCPSHKLKCTLTLSIEKHLQLLTKSWHLMLCIQEHVGK